MFCTDPIDKRFGVHTAEFIWATIFAIILLLFKYVLKWLFDFLIQSYRLKKLYNKIDWPVKIHYTFYEEGFLVDSVDMKGIFKWDDMRRIKYCPGVIEFNFHHRCETRKRKFFKDYYPKLRTFTLLTDDAPEIYELLDSVRKNNKRWLFVRLFVKRG